jgi:hypothetical protein
MYGHGATAKGGGILQEYRTGWIQASTPREGEEMIQEIEAGGRAMTEYVDAGINK